MLGHCSESWVPPSALLGVFYWWVREGKPKEASRSVEAPVAGDTRRDDPLWSFLRGFDSALASHVSRRFLFQPDAQLWVGVFLLSGIFSF